MPGHDRANAAGAAIVRLAEPIALTSIFPYAWALIKRFKFGDEDDASFYAGLLISSFSLAEAVMGMYWGGLSDRIGRKPVLLLGCLGTMVSMVMVGFASNLWLALIGRCLGGLLNGNIGVIQTMVGELVSKPEHERTFRPRTPVSAAWNRLLTLAIAKAYSIMPFVWSIGTIIGPAIGGTFADPRESFPHLVPEGSLFDRFPYLLPNLICAGLMLLSILLGYFLLEETHPDMQTPGVSPSVQAYVSEETPLLETSDAIKRPAVDFRDENYGSIKIKGGALARTWTSESEKTPRCNIFCKRIMSIVLALSIFTYHSMTYDHLLPIFFEDDRVTQGGFIPYIMSKPLSPKNPFYSPGGLGLSLRAVGMIMAVNGVIALLVQAVVFPVAAARFGVYRLFIAVTVLHPIAYVLMPPLLYVPESLLYPAIYLCLTVRNVFSILVYPLLLILIKEATPTPSVLGKVNGMAASAGAACRMVAPPIAGYLYTVGKRMDCTALAWYGSAVVAVVGAAQCFQVQRSRAARDASPEAAAVLPPKARAVTPFSDDDDHHED